MGKRERKPKLSAKQLVEKMRDEKGVTFRYTTEEQAEKYFTENNNYLRTASYRKNYQKYQLGKDIGKYIALDFAYLQELSTLDMYFRFIAYKMCIDIEHSMKVKLIRDVETDSFTDAYDIVKNFLDENITILKKIEATSKAPFTSDLIQEYFTLKITHDENGKEKTVITDYSDCPVWVLMEILTFGDFLKFYHWYYSQHEIEMIEYSILKLVKDLRNGCAHNNCILNDLEHSTSYPPITIKKCVAKIQTLSKNSRKKKLSCRPMLEFVCLLYVYDLVVPETTQKPRMKELEDLFFSRMIKHKEYFLPNKLIVTNYEFACEIIRAMQK